MREWYGVGAPIHLSLLTSGRFEAYHRLMLGALAHSDKALSQDGDPSPVAGVSQLFEHPHSRQLGELLQKVLHERHIGVELASARDPFLQRLMPFLPLPVVAAQDAPDCVPSDLEMPGELPYGKAFRMHGDDQMLQLNPGQRHNCPP